MTGLIFDVKSVMIFYQFMEIFISYSNILTYHQFFYIIQKYQHIGE